MTIQEEQRSGKIYNALHPELIEELHKCEEICFEINAMHPSKRDERNARIKALFGKTGERLNVVTPFNCDFGYNIKVGEDFFANFNMTVLDENEVTFGDHVFIGPNCSFYTACHPLDPELRNTGVEFSKPIHVGNNVWFGGNVTVLPGVTIGNNVTIGAGSVVTHDIPDNVVAAGNPCKIIKSI